MTSKRSRGIYEEDLKKRESPFVFLGTALPPLDEHSRDDSSYVPAWKQEVTDDRGRKRLHGAFTGGYSAGYFNTVGSKDGWTPATFKSSRQNRIKDSNVAPQQRPEDFMDEEDIREDEDSKQLSTAAEYVGFGSTEEDFQRRDTFTDLFRPTGETIGVRLLQRMGWKPGQGIGPKVQRAANLDAMQGEDGESYDAGTVHLFAPEDPPMISFTRKVDRKGLGFERESGLEVSSDQVRRREDVSDGEKEPVGLLMEDSVRSKRGLRGKKGAFGVGILNDTGSDDEDPYQMGPKISYNRTIGAVKKPKRKDGGLQTGSNPLLKNRPVFKPKTTQAKSVLRRCHDGRLPLDGFVLSTELDSFASMDLQDTKYRPPPVPEGWKSQQQPSGEESQQSSYVSIADAAKASNMDAKTRAKLLGETPLPGKSVFDYVTPAVRERIAAASGNRNLPAALSEKPRSTNPESSEDRARQIQDLVPALDSQVALQALNRGPRGWMPYAEDEGKRARYRGFLAIRAGLQDGLPEKKDGMNKEDWVNEMGEFARAAQVFQPVSGLMASRFTSASQHPKPASDQLDSSASREELLSRPAEKPEDAAVKAAEMGMFGALTRSIKDFHPTRLLCKRFNVKPPSHVQVDPGNGTGKGDAALNANGRQFQPPRYQMPAKAGETEGSLEGHEAADRNIRLSSAAEMPGSNINISSYKPSPIVDLEVNEALEAERPGEDVFKAIFGSDDEDD